jgi:signal transduction histidine kinase
MARPGSFQKSFGLRGGLFSQLFLIVFLPLVILMLVVVFLSLNAHQNAMRRLVEQREGRLIEAAAVTIEDELNDRLISVQGLARLSSEQHGLPADVLLQTYSSSQPVFDLGMAVFDGQTDLLALTGDSDFWQTTLSDPMIFEQVFEMADSQGMISQPFLPSGSQQMAVLVSAWSPSGERAAVGALTVAKLVEPLLSAAFPSSTTSVVLVNAPDRKVLYLSGFFPDQEDLDNHPGIEQAIAGETGSTYVHTSHGENVVAYGPIRPAGWALISEESWSMVESPFLRTTLLGPLITIPVLLVAVAAIWFGLRSIVQPLQALESQATSLSWGDFQAVEKPVGGIEEIRRLQMELRHLAHKVQAAQQNLHSYIGAITAGQEEERHRLARELHDDSIQSLIALKQRVQLAQLDSTDEKVCASLNELGVLTEQTIENLRRIVQALRPIYLEDLGLVPALEMLALEVQRSAPIQVEFKQTGDQRRLKPEVELALYRIAQEALSNVTRHSKASRASMTIDFGEEHLDLEVVDNGVGFDAPKSPADFVANGHFGLVGISERTELIEAKMDLKSAPGAGTRLRVVYPLDVVGIDQKREVD